MERNKPSTLLPATKQQLPLGGLILLQICLEHLNTQICFGIAPNVAVKILLATTFIGRFIHGIFSAERNVVPWNSQLVAILSEKVKWTDNLTVGRSKEEPWMSTQRQYMHWNEGRFRVSRQIVPKTLTRYPALVTTTCNCILTIETKRLVANYCLDAAATGVIDVSPQRRFNVYVKNL